MLKYHFLFLISLTNHLICFSQNSGNTTESHLVRVKSVEGWNTKARYTVDEVWNNVKDQIISQIGQSEYDSVRKYYHWKNHPPQMWLFDGKKKRNLKEYQQQLHRLKVMYKIATYRHIFQGKDWGEKVILKVPYKGNEDWDLEAKWDTIYFILDADVIKEVKS